MIQFQFTARAEAWIENLCNIDSATVKVMSLKPDSVEHDGYVTHFVDISSVKSSAEIMKTELEGYPSVKGSDLATVSPNRLIGAVTSSGCGVCGALADSSANCFVAPAQTDGHCEMSYKLFISGEGLPNLLQILHQREIAFTITDVSPLSLGKKMTSRQESVLASALELGFFDYPKRITTEELAKILNIASSTLSEILRRGEKSVVSSHFSGDRS